MSKPPTVTLMKTTCNRFKVITKEGVAKFGSIYNISPQEGTTVRDVPFYECKAKGTIRKSENGKRNQQRICVPGDSMCVLGEYNAGEEAEILVCREGESVYKRKWKDIKDRLDNIHPSNRTMAVIAYGYFKKEDLCFLVKLNNDNNACVWISEKWWRRKNAEQNCMIDNVVDNVGLDDAGFEPFSF